MVPRYDEEEYGDCTEEDYPRPTLGTAKVKRVLPSTTLTGLGKVWLPIVVKRAIPTLGARGQLPSGSMLSTWRVLKQFA